MANGRFAPSPTGALHLGNLRTALVAWLCARSSGGRFVVRMEDLDAAVCRPEHERTQLDDLRALGLDWDGPVVRQSERRARYEEAIATLAGAGRTYPCYCTRAEIHAAAQAPNAPGLGPDGAYPGTCRHLSAAERAEREASGRRPALRLDARAEVVAFRDRICGPVELEVDDVVLRRNDGTPAYNLAVVVDDGAQGVEEVVRGDDLLLSTPRQLLIARMLGIGAPAYVHVGLVLGPDGKRLAKRDGAVTLADRIARGESAADVRSWLAHTLGLGERGEPVSLVQLVSRFSVERLPRSPWQMTVDEL